jgi:NADH-quinone oxidoreductase subunit G
VGYGDGVSRYTEPKLALSKAVDIGPHVMLDQERCIQCSRCIRFCDEVTKTGELGFFQRGERSQIGIFPGKRLDKPYSGNVVDLCPVGALTLKEFRFKTRVWYLKNTPTVCAGCARGCNIVAGVGQQQTMMTTSGQIDDRVKRLVPRVNEDVNGHWMCDEGRLSYAREQAGTRLPTPSIAGVTESYDETVARRRRAPGRRREGRAPGRDRVATAALGRSPRVEIGPRRLRRRDLRRAGADEGARRRAVDPRGQGRERARRRLDPRGGRRRGRGTRRSRRGPA